MTLSLDDQIACAKREIGKRRYVYPRSVANQRMTQITMDKEIAAMEAILATLEAIKECAAQDVSGHDFDGLGSLTTILLDSRPSSAICWVKALRCCHPGRRSQAPRRTEPAATSW